MPKQVSRIGIWHIAVAVGISTAKNSQKQGISAKRKHIAHNSDDTWITTNIIPIGNKQQANGLPIQLTIKHRMAIATATVVIAEMHDIAKSVAEHRETQTALTIPIILLLNCCEL
jgi:hypothetical protein